MRALIEAWGEALSPENKDRAIETVLKYNPDVPIMVKGDAAVNYGRVVEAMVLAQAAGAPSVGLITVPPERLEP
jgi:biopolymer transport protein TolR